MSTLRFELYGELGEKFGKIFELECLTVRQGIDILAANFSEFKQYIVDSDKWLQGYEVWAGDVNLDSKDEDFLMERHGISIKIVPVIRGAGATGRIIAGVVLVVVGAIVGYVFGWTGVGVAVGKYMIFMGAALIIGGVAEKLSPSPKTALGRDTQVTDKATSYIFSGPTNNMKQGVAVPVGYGRMLVGSSVISSAFTTVDIPV